MIKLLHLIYIAFLQALKAEEWPDCVLPVWVTDCNFKFRHTRPKWNPILLSASEIHTSLESNADSRWRDTRKKKIRYTFYKIATGLPRPLHSKLSGSCSGICDSPTEWKSLHLRNVGAPNSILWRHHPHECVMPVACTSRRKWPCNVFDWICHRPDVYGNIWKLQTNGRRLRNAGPLLSG